MTQGSNQHLWHLLNQQVDSLPLVTPEKLAIFADLFGCCGFPADSDGKESTWHCGRPRFNPWVRKIPWRREWQPSPVFLSGEFHGQRSLEGYSPWGHKELDMIEQLIISLSSLSCCNWKLYCHLVGRNEGCCSTSYKEQDKPFLPPYPLSHLITKNHLLSNFTSSRMRN